MNRCFLCPKLIFYFNIFNLLLLLGFNPNYLFRVVHFCPTHPLDTISHIFHTHTSSPHITLNRIELILLRSSSSSFNIYFHNRSYCFRIFSFHKMIKLSKYILSHLPNNPPAEKAMGVF